MADVKPLKLVDQGGGAGRLAEFEAGDTLPKASLPALSAADVGGVAADDARLSDAREWSEETVDQAEAEGGTATTRRAWTAQRVRQAIVAWWNSVSSAWGRGFVASANAAAGRTALELGNAATRTALGTTGPLYSRDSILGTVSQSAGIPTGAIIERGSNANGEYVKFADGTLICHHKVLFTIPSATAVSVPWSYPSTFTAFPNVFGIWEGSSPGGLPVVTSAPSLGITSAAFTMSRLDGGTFGGVGTARSIGVMAVGRWY